MKYNILQEKFIALAYVYIMLQFSIDAVKPAQISYPETFSFAS